MSTILLSPSSSSVSTAPVQQPVGSGFGPERTAADVIRGIDLSGKVAIVTGGYSGIGTETTRALAAAGARVIVPARDLEKASRALEGIERVEVRPMDLLDPASIETFAADFLQSGQPLHLLVLSAGIMACPLTRDSRGYELQFATNHLGHFQLTNLLWPALLKAQGARIVAVSSLGHRFSPVVFEDINYHVRDYSPWSAYGQSKTANVLFALELDRRGRDHGIRAFSVHPGRIVDTGLKRYIPMETLKAAGAFDAEGKPVIDPARGYKTVEMGASTSVWCAVSPLLEGLGGLYCEDNEVALPSHLEDSSQFTLGDTSMNSGVMSHATDPDAAARLWVLSEEMLSVSQPSRT